MHNKDAQIISTFRLARNCSLPTRKTTTTTTTKKYKTKKKTNKQKKNPRKSRAVFVPKSAHGYLHLEYVVCNSSDASIFMSTCVRLTKILNFEDFAGNILNFHHLVTHHMITHSFNSRKTTHRIASPNQNLSLFFSPQINVS